MVVIVTEFVGAKHSMTESIALFSAADVVVAPHGAALGFIAFMRPGSAVVEVGYKELKVKTSEQWCEPVISISWRRRRGFFFFLFAIFAFDKSLVFSTNLKNLFPSCSLITFPKIFPRYLTSFLKLLVGILS